MTIKQKSIDIDRCNSIRIYQYSKDVKKYIFAPKKSRGYSNEGEYIKLVDELFYFYHRTKDHRDRYYYPVVIRKKIRNKWNIIRDQRLSLSEAVSYLKKQK